jgi:hypothetical protein
MCDCIEKINKKIREDSGDETAKLDTVFDVVDGKLTERMSMTYHCRQKNNSGILSDKKKTFSIQGAFCPFCSKPISD